jgi:ABC-2 type transport system permease protein
VFGGAQQLAGMIERGELDFFLGSPRPVLLLVLVSRMNLSGWGDILFGWGAFLALASPSVGDCMLFALVSVSSTGLLVGFAVLAGSLAFWIDDAEGTSQLIVNMLVSLGTHPTPIFRGAVKLALFSVVPAAFIGFVPVELLRTHQLSWLLWHLGVSATFVALGGWVFARGLRRHASGSLFTARL